MTSKQRRLILLVLGAHLLMIISSAFEIRPWYGFVLERKLSSITFGRGRGAPGYPRKRFHQHKVKSLWKRLKVKGDNKRFESLCRMRIEEFKQLIRDLRYLEGTIDNSGVAIRILFQDKILLIFVWLVKYHDYATLSELFGTSPTIISGLIKLLLPHLVEHFLEFIRNEVDCEEHSSLSESIVCVIDGTIHQCKKPPKHQHLHYNKHYKRHGMMTHLLVDFNGYIVAIHTNVYGIIHDSNAARHNKFFEEILGDKFALRDPGYAGVRYVVAGFKSNQLTSEEANLFDRRSRSEQVVIEHVNGHVKACKALSKKNMFLHSRSMHIACVFIVCGWFNWMKETFDKFS